MLSREQTPFRQLKTKGWTINCSIFIIEIFRIVHHSYLLEVRNNEKLEKVNTVVVISVSLSIYIKNI